MTAPAARPATQLSTEREARPLAVDEPDPLLGWLLPPGTTQHGYRVRVVHCELGGRSCDPSDESNPAVWDSGWIDSADSVDIRYAGEPLISRTRYRWAVAVADGSGVRGTFSAGAEFETGVTAGPGAPSLGDWITDSVTAESFVDLDQAAPETVIDRIWLGRPDGTDGTVRFRREFDLPGGRPVQWARLTLGAGVYTKASLNGTIVAAGQVAPELFTPGRNVLAVSGRGSGNHPGLLLRLDVGAWAARAATVYSDGRWRAAPELEADTVPNAADGSSWRQPEFDDHDWALAEAIGRHGEAPFGRDESSLRPSPYLRREFTVDPDVVAARLRCTAIGVYAASLNGSPVSAAVLAPGWVDVAQRLPYQVYDVTDLLGEGANVWGVQLADGWSLGNICWFGRHQYGQQRAFTGELEIHYADGRIVVVRSDEKWQVANSEVRYTDLQNGCVLDARAAIAGWDRAGQVDGEWRPVALTRVVTGPLQAQLAPPIEVAAELAPRRITRRANGNLLIDFGQNLVGWVRLRVQVPAGQLITLSHSEVLDADGELYRAALRTARATDYYYATGDPAGEWFEPRFTVHGFRYCEITGLGAELVPEQVQARVVHAAMRPIGAFSCSDERLNQLQRNIVWSQRGNFLTVPTDCPQRDERLGWTGDAQVFGATAAFNYDVRTFLRKYLLDVRDATGADGGVPHVAPDVLSRQLGVPQVGAAGWGDVIVMLPAVLHAAYGDRRLIAENLEAVAAWLGYCTAHSDGFVRPVEGFGDWLAPEITPIDLVSTAFFAQAARLAAELGIELGDPRAAAWGALANSVRSAFRSRFVRGGGALSAPTQTGYLLALAFELFDPSERGQATDRLVAAIAAKNWHLATGFLGTPYLLPVLRDQGRLEVAYRLLLTETFPSWLYPIVAGDATTIWERWDSWSDSRGFQDPAMTSFNHYAYGAVGEFLYQTIGGLQALEPGYRRSRIAVRPGGGLRAATTSLETPYGRLATDWQLLDDEYRMSVEVPANTEAEVVLPSGSHHQVGPGRHKFSWPRFAGGSPTDNGCPA